MASMLLAHLPPHTCYVEPYCGAASVFFAKGRPPRNAYVEVLNDKDEQLVTFLRVVRDRREEIQRLLAETPFARKEYLRALAILRGEELANDLWTAWAFFVAQQQSYGAARTAFAATPPSQDSQVNLIAATATKVELLPVFQTRLLQASLECRTALECIKTYDAPGTLFYCDPPYAGSSQRYKHSSFGDEQLVALVSALAACQGSAVLSHPQHPAIPDDWPFVEVERSRGIASPSKEGRRPSNKERIYVLDRSSLVSPSLERLLWKPGREGDA